MGRGGGGYNPSNPAPSMLGALNTNFSSGGAGGGFPGGGGGFPSVGESAPSPLDLSEFPSLSRSGAGSGVVGESGTGSHVGGRHTYGSLGHGWGGDFCLDCQTILRYPFL